MKIKTAHKLAEYLLSVQDVPIVVNVPGCPIDEPMFRHVVPICTNLFSAKLGLSQEPVIILDAACEDEEQHQCTP